MYMSLLFLKLTLLTLVISHLRARRTSPHEGEGYEYELRFEGSKEEFFSKLDNEILIQKKYLLLAKTPHKCLISERAGLFNYGAFYHIKLESEEAGVRVCIQVQPKLVSHSDGQKEDSKKAFKKIGLK
jgi:hypothetical protein